MSGISPNIHRSIESGKIHDIESFIRLGENIEGKNEFGQTPLTHATVKGKTEVVKTLTRLGARTNVIDGAGTPLLHRALYEGFTEIALEFLRVGVDKEKTGVQNRTALHIACLKGSVDVVRKLIELGANKDALEASNQTPLVYSLMESFVDVVDVLLIAGANVNIKDKKGITALYYATSHQSLPIVERLIQHGSDPNVAIKNGMTPIFVAASLGNVGIVRALAMGGANVNYRDNRGFTPLHVAANQGKHDVIKELGKWNVDIHATDESGLTSMKLALKTKDERVIKELVRLGDSLENKNSNGNTYLIQAAIEGNIDSVNTLIKAGANLNSTDPRGVTALTHATRGISAVAPKRTMKYKNVAVVLAKHKANGEEAYKAFPDLMRIRMGGNSLEYGWFARELHQNISDPVKVSQLLFRGADVDFVSEGKPPLLIACQNGILDSVRVLLDAGANIENKGNRGYTPLLIASYRGFTEIVQFLLDRGADITRKSTIGHTTNNNSLMMACFMNHIDTMEVLLDRGVDIDDVDGRGNTCLHMAIIKGNIDTMRLLIRKGANVNIQNRMGVSPVMLATGVRRVDMVDILLSEGAFIDEEALTLGMLLRQAKRKREVITTDEEEADTEIKRLKHANTFREEDLRTYIPSVRGELAQCSNIDDIMVEGNRCIQITTRKARVVMMNLLNKPIEPTKIVMPRQSSGTCWFFSTMAALFISDRTRVNNLYLRRSMIMGRTSVNGQKFPTSLASILMRFNIMIQAILDGNTNKGPNDAILPIINSEEVVVGLQRNGVLDKGLNCGNRPEVFMAEIKSLLGGFKRSDMMMLQYTESLGKAGINRTFNSKRYIVDAFVIQNISMANPHVIAGLTIGGQRCLYDSNIGIIVKDWAQWYRTPGKQFTINKFRYTFKERYVTVLFCPLDN